jgi:hypothetical protein
MRRIILLALFVFIIMSSVVSASSIQLYGVISSEEYRPPENIQYIALLNLNLLNIDLALEYSNYTLCKESIIIGYEIVPNATVYFGKDKDIEDKAFIGIKGIRLDLGGDNRLYNDLRIIKDGEKIIPEYRFIVTYPLNGGLQINGLCSLSEPMRFIGIGIGYCF